MRTRRFHLRLVWPLSFLTLLTACSVYTASATPSGGFSAENFEAQQLTVSSPVAVTIVSELPGEIQVISYPAAEVAVDAITTGRGNSEDAATRQAQQGSHVTSEFKDGGVLIQARVGESTPDHFLLHVRVPHGSSIKVDSPRITANVNIAGETKDVTVQVRQGDIAVRGAMGELNLKTDRGSIVVDEHDGQNHTLDLRANTGSITLFALNAKVLASTTNGSIRFVGTLRETNGNSNDDTSSN